MQNLFRRSILLGTAAGLATAGTTFPLALQGRSRQGSPGRACRGGSRHHGCPGLGDCQGSLSGLARTL